MKILNCGVPGIENIDFSCSGDRKYCIFGALGTKNIDFWCSGIEDFFFQAEDGIRDFCLSRGLGDVYKRQMLRRSPFR